MDNILRNLKDIPGVIGSFVLNAGGTLVGKEMPALVPDSIYPEIGRRLQTTFAALDSSAGSYDDLLLKFEEHWLYCRRLPEGLLNVLASASVNYPALRMATNIASTQLSSLIPTAAACSAPTPPPPAATTPQPVAAPAAPRRFWRGQPVD